jgi:uncharacterized protein YcaQ
MSADHLSGADARRIALAAQGFDRRRPAAAGASHLRTVLRQLGLLQLDFVSVVTPAHYQVPFSRLGPYPTALLDELVYTSREFAEQWAHEASILPVETWPLLRHRRAAHRVRPWGFEAVLERHAEYVRWVLEQVRLRGPLAAADLPAPEGVARRIEGDAWVGTIPRGVLEAYFGRGVLAVVGRRPDGARVFDLAERVLPPEHQGRHVDRDEAERELLRRAARAHGIGTAADLADYYRMPIRQAAPRLADLAAAGELTVVQVEGWREVAYLHPQARLPRRIDAAALLSPFDPVVWFRPRTARLFGFEYRFEIYVPAPKRRWGCYVLPFLLGDRLVARVDLKADRDAGRLLVVAAYLEEHAEAAVVAGPLAAELQTLAAWLGLDAVAVGRRGNLARPLAAALRA